MAGAGFLSGAVSSRIKATSSVAAALLCGVLAASLVSCNGTKASGSSAVAVGSETGPGAASRGGSMLGDSAADPDSALRTAPARGDWKPRQRKFHIDYMAEIESSAASARKVRLWIPLPRDTRSQKVESLSVESPVPYSIEREDEFGNAMVYVEVPPADMTGRGVTVALSYDVRTAETLPDTSAYPPRDPSELSRFLEPRGLVVVNDAVRQMAAAAVAGARSDLEKGRALYKSVIETMSYSKSGTGWGKGSTEFACSARHGNCTDYHSLFISLCRACGLPARFEIGFSVPPAASGELKGYHCWAEFYAEGTGWVPVDISEADKDLSMVNYYFGALTENRMLMSVGREIELSPSQDGPRINYFVEPYAEADGATVAVGRKISFRSAASD